MDDSTLLSNYLRSGSQLHFATLVNRHIHWVYSVCRRYAGAELADDVTQAVFATLARKAPHLHPGTSITGWLFNTSRYASATARKIERRRLEHERRAAAMKPAESPPVDKAWQEILPHLDDAVARLSESDRRAILLRYYQGLTHQEAASQLGVSPAAAQRRISRALEKLRARLQHLPLALLPGSFEQSLQTHLITPAPPHVISASISLAGAAPSAPAALIMKGTLAMKHLHTLKLAGIAASLLALTGTGLWLILPAHAAPPSPPSTPVATVPASPQSTADLSTPRAAIFSLSRAIRSGDKRPVNDCLTADFDRGPTPMDAALAWSIAEWRLSHAAERTFPNSGPPTRTSMLTLDFLLDTALNNTPDRPENLTITGNSAILHAGIPKTFVDRIPGSAPPKVFPILTAWSAAPITLAKINNQWKIDLDASFRAQVALEVPADQLTKQTHDLIDEMKRAMEETARDMENKKFATPQQGYEQLMATLKMLPDQYPGFQNSYSIQILPAVPR